MLFNSAVFIFGFLPVVWLVFRMAARLDGPRVAAAWLSFASLAFYLWWDLQDAPVLRVLTGAGAAGSPADIAVGTVRAIVPTLLLCGSLAINFALGRVLVRARAARRAWLALGLTWNIGLLCYFKYWDFFADSVSAVTGLSLPLTHFARLALPLGISFFTFQKIAFLVDAYRGRIAEVRFGDFALFVLFFPQLIAGPIVHHGEFIPQLQRSGFGTVTARQFALGLSVFSVGLFQKCILADMVAPIAGSGFGLVATGTTQLRMQEAWIALLAYSVQLLNDFAGYSHMALGLALLFGLRLPVNFLAPYTSGSIIEFWRRWHITLSAFLRDYVYIPLGGNRHRHLTNLFLTMLLAGLWHGAAWTFVLWGAWHGAGICLNHLWRRWRGVAPGTPSPAWAHLATFLFVAGGWVLFNSPSLAAARSFALSLVGYNGISVPVALREWVEPLTPMVRPRGLFPSITATPSMLAVLAVSLYFAFRGPRLLRFFGVTPDDVIAPAEWQRAELAPAGAPVPWTRFALAGLMAAVAVAALARPSPFLYYQF